MTIDEARRALPGWTLLDLASALPTEVLTRINWEPGAPANYRALEPSYQVTGIAVEADDPAELVERCRALAAVIEAAAGRPVPRTGTAERALQALPRVPPSTELGAPKDTPHQRAVARAQGFSGDMCSHCGSLSMRRAGSCLTCAECGTTTGCS